MNKFACTIEFVIVMLHLHTRKPGRLTSILDCAQYKQYNAGGGIDFSDGGGGKSKEIFYFFRRGLVIVAI